MLLFLIDLIWLLFVNNVNILMFWVVEFWYIIWRRHISLGGGTEVTNATSDCQPNVSCSCLPNVFTSYDCLKHSQSEHFPSSYAHTLVWESTCWQVIISNHSKTRNSLYRWVLIGENYLWALQWLCSRCHWFVTGLVDCVHTKHI